jgi:hypothetical protein
MIQIQAPESNPAFIGKHSPAYRKNTQKIYPIGKLLIVNFLVE